MGTRKLESIQVLYDRTLLWLTLGLSSIGFIMVMSASVPIGIRLSNDPFYFAKRDAFHFFLAFSLSLTMLKIPMINWYHYSSIMLCISIVMLLSVLLCGHSVHGSSRWIELGPFKIQPAEWAKLSLFCYLSAYLKRKVKEVRANFWDFFKPMSIMGLLAILLLAQPDFGTVIVLFATTLAILFMAGVKIRQFLLIISLGIFIATLLVISEPYRMRRIVSFWNPWNDPFGSGYQLTQSLMAFSRGGLCGRGLGNSIQKLEYLPEAHTDFIFAILGEELGYFGVIAVLSMIFFIAIRAMLIGRKAFRLKQYFSGFLSCTIGIWFGVQALVNIGATVGVLPTKGLTLPLISYGGSSLMTMMTAIVLLLRTDFENRIAESRIYM